MIYLLLAILSSAFVSIIMRLSTDRVKANISMLAFNYLMCTALGACFTGLGTIFDFSEGFASTLGFGAVNGFLYQASFIMLQYNVKKNGVVLSATFMKLGLLVPMLLSIVLFGEMPEPVQWIGFALAIAAILLINMKKGEMGAFRFELILLLIGGGLGDAMAKIYEQFGVESRSEQFLMFTFLTAFMLCTALAMLKKERFGKSELFFGLLIGIPNFFSARFLLLALQEVAAVVAYPTYSAASLLAVTAAGVLFFNEKLLTKQWIAIGVILVALVLLNV